MDSRERKKTRKRETENNKTEKNNIYMYLCQNFIIPKQTRGRFYSFFITRQEILTGRKRREGEKKRIKKTKEKQEENKQLRIMCVKRPCLPINEKKGEGAIHMFSFASNATRGDLLVTRTMESYGKFPFTSCGSSVNKIDGDCV